MDTQTKNYGQCISFKNEGFGFIRVLSPDPSKREDIFTCFRFLIGTPYLVAGDIVTFNVSVDPKRNRKVATNVEIFKRATIKGTDGLGTPKAPKNPLAALAEGRASDAE